MLQQLRQFTIATQGLNATQQTATSYAQSLAVIEQLGYVQIDSLSVVERAHHHVLWNRVQGYQHADLNTLLQQKQIFEYWFHAAAYLPMRDFRFARFKMQQVIDGKHRYFQQLDQHLVKEIMAQVQAEGELCSQQLLQKKSSHVTAAQSDRKAWQSTVLRRALEVLYMRGELMVSRREGIQKIYRLPQDCIATDVDMRMPSMQDYARYIFQTMLRSHGVISWKQLTHVQHMGPDFNLTMRELLLAHLADGNIEALKLDNGYTVYIDVKAWSEYQEKQQASEDRLKILSPFDPLVIHRERLSGLFNFDYTLECYVTAAKRRYGYFCLPILFDQQLVARIDCKAHRAEQRLEVMTLHLEACFEQKLATYPDLKLDFKIQLEQALQDFAHFNQCREVDISAANSVFV